MNRLNLYLYNDHITVEGYDVLSEDNKQALLRIIDGLHIESYYSRVTFTSNVMIFGAYDTLYKVMFNITCLLKINFTIR